MLEGILLLEKILGAQMFDTEAEVLLTDRGAEFTLADEIERRDDGTMRTQKDLFNLVSSKLKKIRSCSNLIF